MKGDGVLNLLIFQAFQDVCMAPSLVRYTIKPLEIQGLFIRKQEIGYRYERINRTVKCVHRMCYS